MKYRARRHGERWGIFTMGRLVATRASAAAAHVCEGLLNAGRLTEREL